HHIDPALHTDPTPEGNSPRYTLTKSTPDGSLDIGVQIGTWEEIAQLTPNHPVTIDGQTFSIHTPEPFNNNTPSSVHLQHPPTPRNTSGPRHARPGPRRRTIPRCPTRNGRSHQTLRLAKRMRRPPRRHLLPALHPQSRRHRSPGQRPRQTRHPLPIHHPRR